MPRFKFAYRSLVTLAATLAIGCALTTTADAAWYKLSRPGLTIALRTEGHRVAELKARYTLNCSDGSDLKTIEQRPKFNRRINRRTGRFRWQFGDTGNGTSRVEKGHGIVYRKWITGRFFVKDYTTLGGTAVRCWSGRSNQNPGVSFAARRL
jgi:hypothetical protein